MKPKILFVIHSLAVGGAERLVMQMAAKMLEDYSVGILCLDSKGEGWKECEDLGIELFCAERRAGFSLGNCVRFNRCVKEFKPSIIHAHQYTAFFYSIIAKLSAVRRCPLIFTEHGRPFPDVVSRKRKFANKILFKFCSSVTAVSQFTKDALRDVEGVGSQVRVIYNGVALETRHGRETQQTLKKEFNLPDSTSLVGVVASLRYVKNPMFMIRAFQRVTLILEDAYLVFVGDGPLRSELVSLAQDLGISDKVIFAGIRNPVDAIYKELDVFVLPSFQEASSLAVLEAMNAELPIVVSDGGGSPELILDGKTGVVVASDDDAGLASAIVELITNQSWSSELAQNAKQDVAERFSFEQMLREYKVEYEKLL